MTLPRASNCRLAASLTVLAAVLLGCGSQPLRLVVREGRAGQRYTCTTTGPCYVASVDAPEYAESDPIVMQLPPECPGVQEIVVREGGSSEPEVDVTCAQDAAAAPQEPDPGHDVDTFSDSQ